MMATLNGKPSLPVGNGSNLVAETDDAMQHVTLKLYRGGEMIWARESIGVGPEPTRDQSSSHSADYLALAWPETGVIAVLGEAAVIVLDIESGDVRTSFTLEFTGKESLEQAGLDLTPDRARLVVTSTKRILVLDSALQPLLRYEPRFILAGPPRFDQGRLLVEEYDFDADQELVTQTLDL